MELILSIAGGVLSLLAIILVGLVAFIYKDTTNQLRARILDNERKLEKLDTEVRLLENEKFNVIMVELAEIRKDISAIQEKLSKSQ